MGKYDDIINLPHHVSDFHKPMSMENRAAQFAPFAALTGHNEAIHETGRLTEIFLEPTDEEKNLISQKIRMAFDKESVLTITYFVPDKSKPGGSYKKLTGKIKKIDEFESILLMESGETIKIQYINSII